MTKLSESKLFNLKSKRKLCEDVLGIEYSLESLRALSNDSNYIVKTKVINGKNRDIQEPNYKLKPIHKRIKKLLSRIETPVYLFSSKKQSSYKTNATTHIADEFCFTMDIQGFYQSSQRSYLTSSLIHHFKMSRDLAEILSQILCYREHIPTGSPSSQICAFWAYKSTFDRINKSCIHMGVQFSLYVDDLTFTTSKPFRNNFFGLISREFKKVDLCINAKKTKYFDKNSPKHITGVVLVPGDGIPRIANSKRKIFFEQIKAERLLFSDLRSLNGKAIQMNYVENWTFCTNLRFKIKRELKRAELNSLLFLTLAVKSPNLALMTFDDLFKNRIN